MAHVMVMPKLGLAMEDGQIAKWLKAEGDSVEEGEEYFEVETEKISQAVEADESGTLLKILVPEGETVACFTPIAIIGKPGEDISSLI
ncbi:MAG: biotin/lipoyl-containing protein [Clostridiaceae bacterium]